MTFEDDIEALKSRIAQAESKRDAWRLAGSEEKYTEACSMVDALELQLEEQLLQTRDRAPVRIAPAPTGTS